MAVRIEVICRSKLANRGGPRANQVIGLHPILVAATCFPYHLAPGTLDVLIVGRPGKAHSALGKGIVGQETMLDQDLQGRDLSQLARSCRQDLLFAFDLGDRFRIDLGIELLLLVRETLPRVLQQQSLRC